MPHVQHMTACLAQLPAMGNGYCPLCSPPVRPPALPMPSPNVICSRESGEMDAKKPVIDPEVTDQGIWPVVGRL